MLAKVGADLPPGAFYEPKWDGFRAIVFRDGDEVEIGSRNTRPMARYFPEVVAAALESLPARCVVDGEIVVPGSDGRLDFFSLQQRLHPAASRVDLLAGETPAHFVAFDLLVSGRRGPDGAAVLRAPVGAGGCVGGRAPAGPPHPHHPRRGARARVVRALRGRRPRRHHRQGGRPGLCPRQARDDEDQARADRRLRPRRLPGPQVRAGRDRLADARALRRRDVSGAGVERGRAALGRRRRRVPDGAAARAVRGAAAAGLLVRGAPVELGARARARRRRRSGAAGTRASLCRSCRCGPSACSRSATTTWRARASATRRSSCAGGRIASRSRAATPSSSGRWTSTWRRSLVSRLPRGGGVAWRRAGWSPRARRGRAACGRAPR